MSQLRKIRSVAWMVPLVLGFGDIVQAQDPEIPQGFFADVMSIEGGVNTSACEFNPVVSFDGLTLFFGTSGGQGCQNRPGGQGGQDMWFATRTDAAAPFGNVRNLQELAGEGAVLNSPFDDVGCSISDDNRTLYLSSDRAGSSWNVYAATRSDADGPFEEVAPVEGVNSLLSEVGPHISADGLRLFFRRGSSGSPPVDIWMASRSATDELFNEPERLDFNSTTFEEWWPSVSADGAVLFFSDWFFDDPRRDSIDIWVTPYPFETVFSIHDLWPNSEVNTANTEGSPYISRDWPAAGSKLYFTVVSGSGLLDLQVATWHPDCNENGVDDVEDIAAGTSSDGDGDGLPDECTLTFLRGECHDDGNVDVSDASCLLNWQFLGGPAPSCLAATNTNGDKGSDIADAIYLLSSLFLGGPPPVAPFPECGPGTETDAVLGCVASACE